jgi:protein-disulfide isomerase
MAIEVQSDSGMNGTPTFSINGMRHDGTYDFDPLLNAVEYAMGAVASQC